MGLKPLDLGDGNAPKTIIKETPKEDGTLDVEFQEQLEEEFSDEDDTPVNGWDDLLVETEEEDNDELQEEEGESEEDEEEDDGVVDSEEDSDGEDDEEEDEDFEESDEDEIEETPRANARIRDLNARAKASEAREAEAIARMEAMEERMIELQKNTVASNINLLENNIEAVKGQLSKSHEEGDYAKTIELQQQLTDLQVELKTQKSWRAPERQQRQTQQQQTNQPKKEPEAFKRWFRKNSWFRDPVTSKDKERQDETLAYADRLLNQGFSLEDEDLYVMIDERLGKLGLANNTKKSVKSGTKTKKASSTGRKKKKISQTVQGASRTPASSRRKSNKNKVSLTREQMNMADLYGISYADYAKEVLKMDKAAKQNKRMTTLFE